MQKLDNYFLKFTKIQNLIPVNSHVLIGISGGEDSVVLTHLFKRISHQFNYQITLAHINHCLRKNAKNDETFVRGLADEWGLDVKVIDLKPRLRKSNKSPEAWARFYRYEALERIRTKTKADYVLTGHHRSDQAETILMRLVQGTGGKGFKGIHKKINKIIRPLLSFSKKEIKEYSEFHDLKYIDDETNSDISIPRNFIRKNILTPWLNNSDSVECGIIKTKNNISELFDVSEFSVEYFFKKYIHKCEEKNQFLFLKFELATLPIFVQIGIIRKCLGLTNPQWREYEWDTMREFLINSKTGDIYSIGPEYLLLNNRNEWIIKKKKTTNTQLYKVVPGRETNCGNYLFKWEWLSTSSDYINNNHDSEIIDGGKIQNKKLELRHWKKGDRFQPIGMSGQKKMSDFLIDEKVNLFNKQEQMVLTADSEIIWVCGHRISNPVRVCEDTVKPAIISLIKQ